MTIQNVIFFSKILKSIIEMYNRLLMLYTLLVVLEGYFHWKKTNILLKKKITNASFISWGNLLNQKASGSLLFPGGTERGHWLENG